METIEDIIREKRATADEVERKTDNQFSRELVKSLREEADRIEKAYKSMVEGLNGGIVERDQCIAELTDNNKRIIADRNELVELNLKCCDENERLKAALKPVLDCEYKAYHDGTGVWIDSPGRAVREAQSIWKEGEKE